MNTGVIIMLDRKLLKMLNEQLNREIYSGYLYWSMASWFDANNLKGFAHWMKKQAEEEINHAKKFYEYINDRQEKVEMLPVEAPKSSWSSPLEVFEDTFAHEQKVTEMINSLVDAAREANDHATFEFLQWFVKEQVEEEANAEEVVQKLRFAGDSPSVILMLDQALGSRED